ncbi:hypothetical protein V499_08166 [Pseudogymnoascus sp. VKM F-103]|nr:hypothetical protein V499_08166 [Pseudogymnoascus sp. VKM F-103]
MSSGKIELWRQATAAPSSECLRDDKFGSAILIAGAALLQRLLLLPPREFSGLTSEPKAIYWAAMDVVVIITSVKNKCGIPFLEISLDVSGILAGRVEWDGLDCCGLL